MTTSTLQPKPAASPFPREARAGVAVHRRTLGGVLAAALALAAGRWGSYIGRSPLFLTDLLVLAACVRLLWIREQEGRVAGATAIRTLMFLFVWAVIRFVLGGRLDTTALRDAAPYFYAVLGLVAASSLGRSTAGERERTARFLVWALGFHAVWVFVEEVLHPAALARLPMLSSTQGVRVLTVRPDFDVAVVGVYAAFLLWRAVERGWNWKYVLGLCLSWVAILDTHSRAGVLGAVLASLVVVWFIVRPDAISYRARMAMSSLAIVAVTTLVFALPSLHVGQRLLSGFGLRTESGSASGAGTTHARESAWKAVIDWTASSPTRAIVGVGFGPDFMSESGALEKLVGTNQASPTEPRSPHSWWIGTFARLGLAGFVGAVALLLALIGSLRRLRLLNAARDEPLLQISILVLAALIVPLSVGVILESPFGAVPFFWCAGVLLSYGRQRDI